MTAFALPFFGGEVFALTILARSSPALVGLMVLVVAMNMAFYHLLKAPTMLGRRILDRIEGFKMFLGATEADRLQRMVPAERTPELYEKYLPYALALGVEQAWTEQFADVLATAMRPDGSGYHPGWYSGSGFDSARVGSFAGAVGSSLSGAIAASTTAPGSALGRGRRRLVRRRGRGWGRRRLVANVDGFVNSPISALRFIALSLRRTLVRLTPRNSRALNLASLQNHRFESLFTSPSTFDRSQTAARLAFSSAGKSAA